MPPVYYLYIDGVVVTTISGFTTFYVESDGLWSEAHATHLWTYAGAGTFLGFSATSGAIVPDAAYAVGENFSPSSSSSLYLYSVDRNNETYITSDIDLTSVANAIRTKGGTSASLVYPTGYVSAINALPTGALQSYKSAVFTTPGSATLTPDSGYIGIEEISVEYSPSIYDGAYHTEQSSVTDLTGTTWLFNSTINIYDVLGTQFAITFTSNNTTFSYIFLNTMKLTMEYGTTRVYWDDLSDWANQNYRTVSISGGTDATNATLIAWLQANAAQIS